MYGQSFQLTFKGEKTFKTMIGAVVTSIVLISMISYVGFKLQIMFMEEFYSKNLQMARCGNDNFNYDKKNESAYADFNQWQQMWLYITDKRVYEIGNFFQIKQHVQEDFQLRFASQYFDFNDQVTPIKKFIEDRYFLPIQTSQKKSMNVFARKSTVTLNDGIIPFFGSGRKIEFVKVDNIKPYNSEIGYNYDNCYILISLRMDFEGELMTRDVYTFTDLLSDMGGIYSSLFAFGAIIVGIFSETLFYKQIIKDIYQVRPTKRGLSESKKNRNEVFINEKNNDKNSQKQNQELNNQTFSLMDKFTLSNSQQQIINQEQIEHSQLSQSLDKSNSNLRRMKMPSALNSTVSIKPIVNSPRVKIIKDQKRSNSSVNQIKQNLKYRSVYLYNKGVQKIDNEFDAINSDSSDNDSEEDDVALVKKLRSQNKFIRLMALGRVKHNIQGYFNQERKFKEIDHKLVKGIINHYEGEAQLKLKGFQKIKQKIIEINEERVLSSTGNKDKKLLLNLLSNDMYQVIENQQVNQSIKNDDDKKGVLQNQNKYLQDQEQFRPQKQFTSLDWEGERDREEQVLFQKSQTHSKNIYEQDKSSDGLITISNLEFNN
eukprot:403354464